ncbi:hypothetical protein DB31_1278 [Hyalangium minutum]|uniref:Uncharacterized protein n=1 Tax=Hyalangium minutum TaxID=394096 RepID=A0A085WEV0_9BACT|nr:hypothetical protein DB31_1278 [Hyalangium minutum]
MLRQGSERFEHGLGVHPPTPESWAQISERASLRGRKCIASGSDNGLEPSDVSGVCRRTSNVVSW